MNTIILPGFSLKNKVWAKEIKISLDQIYPTSIIYWKHWESGQPETHWVEKEANRIHIGIRETTNIVAKSIGTAVAMQVINLQPSLINKIIFCGLPLRDLSEDDKKIYFSLKTFNTERFICFQNEEDNHGNYQDAKTFIHSLNPQLNIISKPRSDHEYLYPNDFIDFLSK